MCSVFNNHLVDKLLKSPDFEEDNQLSLQRDAKFFETNAEKIVESVSFQNEVNFYISFLVPIIG